MATIGDVLRHLVQYAAALSEDHRAEFTEAVNEAYPPPEPPAPPTAEQAAAAELAAARARVAELEAQQPGS